MKLNARQVVASAAEYPEYITESHITHGEMLGINKSDTKYCKRDKNVQDVNKVYKHLSDARWAALGDQDEEPTTSAWKSTLRRNIILVSVPYSENTNTYGYENLEI